MIDFGPFRSFRWPGSLYFASVFSPFCFILMINFGPFDSFLFILMIHFGPFGSFQWPSSLYFTSFRWFWMILTHSAQWFWSIWLILMINFASFESFHDSFWSIWIISVIRFSLFCFSLVHSDDYLVHLIRFDSLWWFVLVHVDHFSDQVLSILLNFADFGWFWHILPIDFDSFQFLLMIHFGLFASVFVNFESFWAILIHFHSFLLIHFGPFASFWTTGLSLFLIIPFILGDFDPFSFISMFPFGPCHSFSFILCN